MFQVYHWLDPSSGAPLLSGLASLPRGVFESLPRLAQLELRDNLLQERVFRRSLMDKESEHEAGFYVMFHPILIMVDVYRIP